MTLVYDLNEAAIESIGEGHKAVNLGANFEAFPQECRGNVEAISLDKWPTYYINAYSDKVPAADDKMVFDRFHIMWYVVEGVDKIRKPEHKVLMKVGECFAEL